MVANILKCSLLFDLLLLVPFSVFLQDQRRMERSLVSQTGDREKAGKEKQTCHASDGGKYLEE